MTFRSPNAADVLLLLGALIMSPAPRADGSDAWHGFGPPVVQEAEDSYDVYPWRKISVDRLWLHRDAAASQDVLIDSTGLSVLDAGDMDFSWSGGWRADLTFFDESGWDLHLGFFWADDFEAAATRSGDGLFYVFYSGVPADPVDSYTAQYESNMMGAEFNVRRRMGQRFACLLGIRALDVSEKFNIVRTAEPDTAVRSRTENKFYGFQAGAEALVWSNGYARLECNCKAALLYNDVDVHAEALNAGGEGIALDRGGEDYSFLGEAGVYFVVPIWPGHLRLGYQVMWLERVALAPDQNDSFSIFTGEGDIDAGSLLLHGGFIGWELLW